MSDLERKFPRLTLLGKKWEAASKDLTRVLSIMYDSIVTAVNSKSDSQRSGFTASISTDQDIPSGAETTIQFDTEEDDVEGEFNTGTYTFTAKEAGKYQVSSVIYFNESLADGTAAYIALRKNAASYVYIPVIIGAAGNPGISFSIRMVLAVGDTLLMKVYHTHGANRELYGSLSHFSVAKVT